MNKKILWGTAALVGLALAGVVVLVGSNQPVSEKLSERATEVKADGGTMGEEPMFGGTGTHFPSGLAVAPSTTTIPLGKFVIGHLGTPKKSHIFGTCNAYGASAGIAASSTAIYMCTATGVRPGDLVHVQLPLGAHVATAKAGGTQAFGGDGGLGTGSVLSLGGAGATTSDVIGFEIINIGPASTTFRQATTGIQFWADRP